MLCIDDKFPFFELDGSPKCRSKSDACIKKYTWDDVKSHWSIFICIPAAFTFVCPTELKAFDGIADKFDNVKLFGLSTDSAYVWRAWRKYEPAMADVSYPLLSDVKKDLAIQLGLLATNGLYQRSTVIVNPEGIIKHISATDNKVGRSSSEVLRTMQALQSDKMTACDWKPGDSFI